MLLSRYERMIARRYLLPGRGEAFIAMVAGISLVAVMLGVAALVVVMSVMNGFRAELFDKIVGLNGHAVVQGYGGQLRDWRAIAEAARKTPGVTAATPLIENPLMASFNGRVAGVLVRGMRVPDIRDNKTLNGKVVIGSLDTLTPGAGNVAIGSRLAESLGATEGSEIQLISPEGPASPFGTVPRIVSYRVGAIFEVGIFDYDKLYIVMPIEDAQTLLLMGDSVGMVEMDVTDPDKVGQIVAPLVDKVGRARADHRLAPDERATVRGAGGRSPRHLHRAVDPDHGVDVQHPVVADHAGARQDRATSRSCGRWARRAAGMMRIFMTVGTSIGAVGIGAGLILGFILLYFRQGIVSGLGTITGQQIWDPSMRFLTELPAKTDPLEIVGIAAMAFAFSVLATLYPAFKAANTDPVQVLRYD